MRDFLNLSEQGALESGRYEIVHKASGHPTQMDANVPDGAKRDDFEIRRASLPEFWSGDPMYRYLRDMLIAILPATNSDFRFLPPKVFCALRDAGYRAIDIESESHLMPILRGLDEGTREKILGTKKTLIVIGDGVCDDSLPDDIRDWATGVEANVLFGDLLLRDSKTRQSEAFSPHLPATIPCNFSPGSDLVAEVCRRLLTRLRFDAHPQSGLIGRGLQDIEQLAGKITQVAKYAAPSASVADTWIERSRQLDEMLRKWLSDARANTDILDTKSLKTHSFPTLFGSHWDDVVRELNPEMLAYVKLGQDLEFHNAEALREAA